MNRVAPLSRLVLQSPLKPFARNASSVLRRKYGINNKCRVQSATGFRSLSTQAEASIKDEAANKTDSSHNVEKPIGSSEKREFQAETRVLLDIVAKSLYSNKEVFVRELISNASDALEKLRYVALAQNPDSELEPLEIKLTTDKQNRILTIQDNGIGMTKEELVSNLGTIARSGTKAFLEELKKKSSDTSSVIGQFGVGFYSSFMVANKVEVYTKSWQSDSTGYCWTSDGTGTYEIQEADGVQRGTKIVLHLKGDCREFCDEHTLQNVIKKYSNFVNSAIYVNGKKTNVIQPLWLMDAKQVTKEQHKEFYQFIANAFDEPRFVMHYKTDAPLTIRALFYFPTAKPMVFDLNTECEVALYARRVLIKSKANEVLPKWCRFIKGIVDSEDIPLNLSRELLQNSQLIAKLRDVLANRVIKFLTEKAQKEPEEYNAFFNDYGIYIKSGIILSSDSEERESISKLLKYESSMTNAGETVSLTEYCRRMPEDQKDIYYLHAPSRRIAEVSPYYESLKKKNIEVLFCYQPYDEQLFMQLRTFNGKNLIPVEKHIREDKQKEDLTDLGSDCLSKSDIESLIAWVQEQLREQAFNVTVTNKLDSHPCVVTADEMSMARQYLKVQPNEIDDKMRYSLLKPTLELNPRHPIIKKLNTLSSSNPELASLVIKLLFTNAMHTAGLLDESKAVFTDMNKLLTLALEKH